jgi:hypothetical protein
VAVLLFENLNDRKPHEWLGLKTPNGSLALSIISIVDAVHLPWLHSKNTSKIKHFLKRFGCEGNSQSRCW